MPRARIAPLAVLALSLAGAGCSANGGAAPTEAGPPPGDGAGETRAGDGPRPPDGPRAEKPGSPDLKPCQPPMPPKPNAIDTCRLAHRPTDKNHLSSKTPAPTTAVTVRLEAQAGDVQKATLRAWTGLARELPMALETSAGGIDTFKVTLPPSARPIYYRFKLEEGSATLHLTAKGPQTATPTGADDFFIAPVVSGKTIHYPTDFGQPEAMVKGATGGYTKQPMVSEGAGRAGVHLPGTLGQEVLFYVRDAASGKEDHAPGGGDYRLAPDLLEGWLAQGTIFDVDPTTISLDLVDGHTHPYGAGFTYDPQPMIQLLPPQGIGRALSMAPGSTAAQRSVMGALHQQQRWILPLVWVQPQVHTVAEVESLLQKDGFKGLKFHPVVHNFPADGAFMDPFLILAAKYRVPVQIHSATDDNARPWRIVALAKRNPGTAIVMIHTELGVLDKTATLSTIKGQPNIYAETSWTNPESILQAMSTLDSSRTLFGTDSTVDGYQQMSKQSIANPLGQYVYTIPQVIAKVKAQANPAAYANWARLVAIRLYDLRFRPEADLLDTDGDGQPDLTDPDADNDGQPNAQDSAPTDPGK